MPTLRDKINETTPGWWACFLREFCYNHSHQYLPDGIVKCSCRTFTASSVPNSHGLHDLADYLEGLAFKEVEKLAEKEAGWVLELQKRKEKNDPR